MVQTTTLKRTVLFAEHQALTGRMVPFAGYEMPVQYAAGVRQEHLHTRQHAGLFDVSHMGQLLVSGPAAAEALEALLPVDLMALDVGRQRYALLTDENGGICDDLMVANLGQERFLLVVNAACKADDLAYLRAHLPPTVTVESLNRALIALQGPDAESILSRFSRRSPELSFMEVAEHRVNGVPCIVARAGYTGEDGFELSVPEDYAVQIWQALLAEPEVEAAGLGARDSLRLEAGLCLYGQDIGPHTTPVEAGLGWSVSPARRTGGARAGGFPGAGRILAQLDAGSVECSRVGLKGHSRAPVRTGTALYDADGQFLGEVTSGTFGPSADAPVAMAYLPQAYTPVGTEVFARVRGKDRVMTVTALPFVPKGYVRR